MSFSGHVAHLRNELQPHIARSERNYKGAILRAKVQTVRLFFGIINSIYSFIDCQTTDLTMSNLAANGSASRYVICLAKGTLLEEPCWPYGSREGKCKSHSIDFDVPEYSATETYLKTPQSHEATAVGHAPHDSEEAVRDHKERIKKEIEGFKTDWIRCGRCQKREREDDLTELQGQSLACASIFAWFGAKGHHECTISNDDGRYRLDLHRLLFLLEVLYPSPLGCFVIYNYFCFSVGTNEAQDDRQETKVWTLE